MDLLSCCSKGDEVGDEVTCKTSSAMFEAEPLTANHLTSTPLFDAIQNSDWSAVDFFLESGSFSFSPFQYEEQEGVPIAAAEDQAETWIVCDNDEGKLLWRQLPLHAAICYGAPFNTVRELVKIYPPGLCSADAGGNLPIHLAIKFNRPENIVRLLLKGYPEAFHAKNGKGLLPLEMATCSDDKAAKERYEMLRTFVECQYLQKKKESCQKQGELEDLRRSVEEARVQLVRVQRELWYQRTFPIHINQRRFLKWRKSKSRRKDHATE